MVFELLLNAVKVAVSKDVRDSAASVVDLLRRSPDWEKSIGTIEAKISVQVRERAQLIADLVADKLQSLNYQPDSIQAFRNAIEELTANAFEHGISDANRQVVRIVVETTPSYVATTVHNPKGSRFDLAESLESAAQHRSGSHNTGRGRGLMLVSRRADVLEMVGAEAIKALVYRDAVQLETHNEKAVVIAIVRSGHANPSLPRRLRLFLDEHAGKPMVLCLDPREFDAFTNRESERMRGVPKTTALGPLLKEVRRRNAEHHHICIVAEPDMRDLLPELDTAPTIEAAIAAVLYSLR